MKKCILLITALMFVITCSYGQPGLWTRLTPGTEHIRNGNTGNVGIGTDSAIPQDKLHVIGNIRGTQYNSTNGIYNTLSTANFSLQTNGITRMTLLNSNGFVGIDRISS